MGRGGCLRRAFTHRSKTVSIEKKNTAAALTAKIRTYNIGRLFCPHAQFPRPGMYLVARTSADPEPLAKAVIGEIHAVDQNLPVDASTHDAGPDSPIAGAPALLDEHAGGVRGLSQCFSAAWAFMA